MDTPIPTQPALAAARENEGRETFELIALDLEKTADAWESVISTWNKTDIVEAWQRKIKSHRTAAALLRQPAEVTTDLAALRAELAAAKADYFSVADAICKESTSVQDLCRQARQLRADLAAKGEREKTLLTALRNMRDLIHHNVSGKVNLAWAEEIDEADELLRTSALSAHAANKGENGS